MQHQHRHRALPRDALRLQRCRRTRIRGPQSGATAVVGAPLRRGLRAIPRPRVHHQPAEALPPQDNRH
ncbi:hypothetical protein IscW_ISCW019309 [Ixodes scapularis]|uniref:Uncharacterized protein n=1 Tax=Ixodes scapularis TaxID=6945 RepID=B7PT07_IXOSC|nr:hypothetical protein IscW_ISCW019309 [Ixodes scapularis]|eukprot:XP_002403480.1 hypothetical protein IscW_ISCW019309 [Ixodes scapularis]